MVLFSCQLGRGLVAGGRGSSGAQGRGYGGPPQDYRASVAAIQESVSQETHLLSKDLLRSCRQDEEVEIRNSWSLLPP